MTASSDSEYIESDYAEESDDEKLLSEASKLKSIINDDNKNEVDENEEALVFSDDEDDEYDEAEEDDEEFVQRLAQHGLSDDGEEYEDSQLSNDKRARENVPQQRKRNETQQQRQPLVVSQSDFDYNDEEEYLDFGSDDDDLDDDEDDDYDEDLDDDDLFVPSDEEGENDEELNMENGAFKDALREAANFKKRKNKGSNKSTKKKTLTARIRELDPVVRMKLSEANEAFVSNDINAAQKLYQEVIRRDPKNFPAFKALGEIFKNKGRLEECCICWVIAAQLNPRDAEFWATVAELSLSLGNTKRALYCYRYAIRHDTKDHKYLWERAKLNIEVGRLTKALTDFQKIWEHHPTDQRVVIELAKLYSDQNRINDAINMYLQILNHNIEYYSRDTDEPKDFPDFEWSELNILSELFYKQGRFKTGLEVVKQTARWLQGRSDESFWDDEKIDAEFDERRTESINYQRLLPMKKHRPYDLPIDIRVKLGLFRLRLNDISEAIVHFNFLLEEQNVEEVYDLFLQVGGALENVRQFKDALRFYTPLSYLDSYATVDLVASMGRCLQEIGDYEQAVEAYETVLEAEPDNLNVKLALAETLYYHGATEKSQNLMKEVRAKSKELLKTTTSDTYKANLSSIETSAATTEAEIGDVSTTSRLKKKKRKQELSEGEKKDLETKLISDTHGKYERLKRLWPLTEHGDTAAINVWIQLASELIEVFCGVKSLFIKERMRPDHELVYNKRSYKMDIDQRLDKLAKLHELANSNYHKINPSFTLDETSYRGLDFDIWFDIFMEYALLLAKYDDADDATQAIEIAGNVTVFQKDQNRQQVIRLVKLSVNYFTKDYENQMTAVRDILNASMFAKDSYRLFTLSLGTGRKAVEAFISLNHQKYFLRQIKGWDSLRFGKFVSGQAKMDENENINYDYSKLHPYLVSVYSQVMLGGKSYFSAIVYLLKIYNEFKNDPLVCFLLGIACLHRAMQRLVENRHMFVLQAICFFNEYKELRIEHGDAHEAQEVDFNTGRLFQQLGLTTIAAQYYEKVLTYTGLLEDYDLKKEAAYNLYLIYNTSGNPQLARLIMDKYLTV